MRHLPALACAAVALSGALASRASAQDELPPEVRGIKIVVPSAQGKSAHGTKALTAALRKELEKATGGLISEKELDKARKKLKLKGKASWTEAALAAAGREAGAQYVLFTEVGKDGWKYTAHAVLINTSNAALDMDFRSSFFKPGSEAADRGVRIARTTAGKIAKLLKDGAVPPVPGASAAVAVAKPPPAPAANPLDDRIEDDASALPPSKPTPAPTPAARPTPPPMAAATPRSTPPPSAAPPSAPPRADPAPRRDPPPEADPVTSAPPPETDGEATAEVGAEPSDPSTVTDMVLASLTAGSGLLHSYELSSERVVSSGLSYRLSPVALFAGRAEYILPGVGLGVFGQFMLSPLAFEIEVDNRNVASPSGMLTDLGFGVDYHIAISGSGRMAYEVVPAAGLRIGLLSVDKHPANFVLSSSAISPFVGVGLRLPLTEMVEVTVGFDGGIVVSYSESPDTSGAGGGSGFQFGGGLAARFWVSEMIGVALDARFDLQSVGLDGTPSRPLPPDENLDDASISTRDLRTSLGVAFRL